MTGAIPPGERAPARVAEPARRLQARAEILTIVEHELHRVFDDAKQHAAFARVQPSAGWNQRVADRRRELRRNGDGRRCVALPFSSLRLSQLHRRHSPPPRIVLFATSMQMQQRLTKVAGSTDRKEPPVSFGVESEQLLAAGDPSAVKVAAPPQSPERRLLTAFLQLVIWDCRCGDEEALAYIFDDTLVGDAGLLTFRTACDLLDVKHDVVRDRIAQMPALPARWRSDRRATVGATQPDELRRSSAA